jgi:Skp family chaperone for outer membrane proteins
LAASHQDDLVRLQSAHQQALQQAHALAQQVQSTLSAKESELQQFSIEVRTTLDAKEAELQRMAADARQALQAQATQSDALSRELAALQQRLAQSESELRAVLSSRCWRWTAPFRRGGRNVASGLG